MKRVEMLVALHLAIMDRMNRVDAPKLVSECDVIVRALFEMVNC